MPTFIRSLSFSSFLRFPTLSPLFGILVLQSLLLILLAGEVHAVRPYWPVHPDPVLEPWRWQSFPELKGLGLQCMVEGRDGKMWFGTSRGVWRYDGLNWTAYTREDAPFGALVFCLLAARDGGVYAGTSEGISRFWEGRWSRVFPAEGELPWPIWDLLEASDGSLWAGTSWGALRRAGAGWTLYTTEEIEAALQGVASGIGFFRLPVEAPAGPLQSYRGTGIRVRREDSMVISLIPGGPADVAGIRIGDRILRSEPAPEGAAGPGGDIPKRLTVQRPGLSEPFEALVTPAELKGTFLELDVDDVYEDREGALWFGMGQGELIRYTGDPQEGASGWRVFTRQHGLDTGSGTRILQSRDGLIWTVSNWGHSGVNRFDPLRLAGARSGQASAGLGAGPGLLPAGPRRTPGESRGEGQAAWTHVRLSELGGIDVNPSILEAADGTVWVGGHGGYLHAWRDSAWTVYSAPDVPLPTLRTGLVEASDGALWIGGSGQEAVRLDTGPSRWMTYKGLNFQCEAADGAAWFLSEDGGVVRCAEGVWTRYGVEDGLMDTPVALVVTPEGVVWAAGSHDSTAATARFDPLRVPRPFVRKCTLALPTAEPGADQARTPRREPHCPRRWG